MRARAASNPGSNRFLVPVQQIVLIARRGHMHRLMRDHDTQLRRLRLLQLLADLFDLLRRHFAVLVAEPVLERHRRP